MFINRSEKLDYISWRRTAMMMSSVRMTIADVGDSLEGVAVYQDRQIPCRAKISFFCVDNKLTLT